MVYIRKFKRIDLATNIIKMRQSSIYIIRVKRDWNEKIEWCMTYREMICDIMQVKPKYGEMSRSNYKISKHDFRTSKKLIHHPSHGMEPTDWMNGRERPINRGLSEHYKFFI